LNSDHLTAKQACANALEQRKTEMTKTLTATVALTEQTVRDGFSMVGMHHPALDPFMDVTLFSMSQPTFRPHPHAGFSAVTYMLPESEGAFINRDSLGDRSRIGPGAIHWTQAGAGMLHEEIPEQPGVVCRGFQIFVKLPREQELLPPAAFHVAPHDVPVVTGGGWRARVLAGAWGPVQSALPGLANDVSLYDVSAEPGAVLSLPARDRDALWAMLMQGDIEVGGQKWVAPIGFLWGALDAGAAVACGPRGARLLAGGGPPLNESYRTAGPFALSTDERLSDARRRFSQGAMGSLSPSF
jgi:redox-sensitive bicupin YhaK (pirin superfamily)